MSRTSTERTRHALNGPTMGTRWSALFFAGPDFDPAPVQVALQAAVGEVDAQMSTWIPESDISRLNAAPVGQWIDVPAQLLTVIRLGLDIGRASGGAFDIAMGDAVLAWGFGAEDADYERIRAAMSVSRLSAHELLEIDHHGGRVRKQRELRLDLNGIAKGYGVDRLAETLADFGIRSALVGIDGEMRALGLQPDDTPWTIAVEAPDIDRRAPHSILTLADASVATSGDYRHWVDVYGRRLSHTMDPALGLPLGASPASVTVVARTCAEADAWATALMVLGIEEGSKLAKDRGLDALFLTRSENGEIREHGVGALFGVAAAPDAYQRTAGEERRCSDS